MILDQMLIDKFHLRKVLGILCQPDNNDPVNTNDWLVLKMTDRVDNNT